MEIIGKIFSLSEPIVKSDKFQYRELVLVISEGGGKYMNYPSFQLSGNRIDIANQFPVGSEVVVSFDINGRPWTGQDGVTKYFNTISAWKIVPYAQQAQAYQQGVYAPYPPQVQNLAQAVGAQPYSVPMGGYQGGQVPVGVPNGPAPF